MKPRCKKCGKPLKDPISIARGMGPKCAGSTTGGKAFHASQRISGSNRYQALTLDHVSSTLFSFVEEPRQQTPVDLDRFPPDLVSLVLSAPTSGDIPARIKFYSRQKKQDRIPAARLLKQIRRMCIEFRLMFWPGLLRNLQPIPCIPCGENDWKIGEDGRVCSKDELVAYLSRYGIIASQWAE